MIVSINRERSTNVVQVRFNFKIREKKDLKLTLKFKIRVRF